MPQAFHGQLSLQKSVSQYAGRLGQTDCLAEVRARLADVMIASQLVQQAHLNCC